MDAHHGRNTIELLSSLRALEQGQADRAENPVKLRAPIGEWPV
jgi:hypothetical protein